jgi:hypothetical protein
MKAPNQKKQNTKANLFNMLLGMFALKDEKTAYRRAFHHAFVDGGNPEFYPKKHTVSTYAGQNKKAKKRKKAARR